MSRRTLERKHVRAGNPQLRVHVGSGMGDLRRHRPELRPAAAVFPPPAEPAPSTPERTPVDDLWTIYRADPTRPARDRLVVHYTPLVQAVAHRIAVALPSYVEMADLVQNGVFGLITAIDRFDPDRCPRFESYAAPRIRGAILDELRAQDWVPRTVRGRIRERERAQECLESRLLRAASDRELARELGVPVRELQAQAEPVTMLSIEALAEHGDGVADVAAADEADPAVVVQAREMSRQLRLAVSRLGERDRTVITLYYSERRTLADIGRSLGLTESRVCQLHSRAVLRLRGHLDELAAS